MFLPKEYDDGSGGGGWSPYPRRHYDPNAAEEDEANRDFGVFLCFAGLCCFVATIGLAALTVVVYVADHVVWFELLQSAGATLIGTLSCVGAGVYLIFYRPGQWSPI